MKDYFSDFKVDVEAPLNYRTKLKFW